MKVWLTVVHMCVSLLKDKLLSMDFRELGQVVLKYVTITVHFGGQSFNVGGHASACKEGKKECPLLTVPCEKWIS